jgi:O-succinylbenzoic acid--CoA ligase
MSSRSVLDSQLRRPTDPGASSLPSMPELVGAGAEALALPNPIASLAASTRDHAVLSCEEASWSAAHLADETARRAARLHAMGLRPGDRIALLGAPSADWVLSFHAIGWLGGVAICLAPSDTPEENLRRVREGEVALLCCDAGWRQRLEAYAAATELSNVSLTTLDLDDLPQPEAALPERFWPLTEPRVVVYTSGTTARPRPQVLTVGQLVFSAFASASRLGHDPRDRWLCCVPLHHVAGLSILMRCAFMGTCVLLHPRFDAERVGLALDRGEASLVSLVPTMLQRVLDARPDRPLPASLRAILLGGAPASQALIERCRALQAPVALTWGTSETASQICTRAPGDLAPEGGVGLPLPFSRVSVEGEGRLAVRGPTAAGGRVLTQDLGHGDELGRVHIEGRVDDVIISGGEKVLPGEIEARLELHPAVIEAAVVGRADPSWGVRPVAFVVLAKSDEIEQAADATKASEALTQQLLAHCRAGLPGYKVPDAFVSIDALPRTENGKLQRASLRARLEREPGVASAASPAPRPSRDGLIERFARAAEQRSGELPPTLSELQRHYADDLQQVTAAQLEVVADAEDAETSAERAAHHLLSRGGKQLRALCTLLCAELAPAPSLGERPPQNREARGRAARQLAAAAELAHAATLLHDDVIDQGDERRGAPTARVVYGNKASVLAGDHLLTAALVKVEEHGGGELLSRMLDVLRTMVVGEALQFEHEGRLTLDAATYLRIIESKTAALFGWCLRAGGTLAGLPAAELELLESSGRHFGIAFQLVDDLLDLDGDPTLLGKGNLLDLAEGKLTWPVLLALHQSPSLAGELEAQIFAHLGSERAPSPEQLASLRERIRATGAIEQTRREARARTTLAKDALMQLAASPAQQILLELIKLCAERAR